MWQAWRLDGPTWAWIGWIGWFLAWETAGVLGGYQHTLTAHLRPLWLEHPLAWWLALGLWLWLGVHMLAPAGEELLLRAVTGRG